MRIEHVGCDISSEEGMFYARENDLFKDMQEDSKNRRRPAGHSCVMFRDKG